MTTIEKISKLRQKMQEKGINAFIVYSADPHIRQLFQRQEASSAGYGKIHAFFFEASQNLLEAIHIKLTFTV